MEFVTFGFLIFIAATILVYFLIPGKYQWCVLLAASYVFFFLNSQWLVLVLLGTTVITFFVGQWIGRKNREGKAYLAENGSELGSSEKKAYKSSLKKKTRRVLILGIILNLAPLLFLKYFNFFAGSLNKVTSFANVQIPMLNLLLPIGISFYTLQAIAYITDVYRDKYEEDRNLLQFMLFMSYFPQIVQGPIARHDQLAHQLYAPHKFNYYRLAQGAQLILWGCMKKLVIADRLAIPVDQIFDHPASYSGLMAFLGAAFYGIQVYADFSGGMDIARGVSEILGIEIALNFNQPYFSISIEDFWRRWHMTLGQWMRDYVFYPLSFSKAFSKLGKQIKKKLGNSLGKKIPAFIAMFIVYFFVGLWHGPKWTYIAYGIYNGIFIVAGILLGDTYLKWRHKLHIKDDSTPFKVFQMIRTFFIVSFGRFFSRGSSFLISIAMIRSCFSGFALKGTDFLDLGVDLWGWIVLIAGILLMFTVDILHEKKVHIRETIGKFPIVLRWFLFYLALAIVLVVGIYGPGYDSAGFIYEQF